MQQIERAKAPGLYLMLWELLEIQKDNLNAFGRGKASIKLGKLVFNFNGKIRDGIAYLGGQNCIGVSVYNLDRP